MVLRSPARLATLAITAAVLAGVAGCTEPPATAGPTAVGTPVVRSIEPAVPLPSPTPQTVRVFGLEFRAGLAVSLTPPGGSVIEIPASALQLQSATEIDLSVTLTEPGTYRIVVRNGNGFRSDPFDFSVVTALDRRPIVESILPASVARSTVARAISITGRNFLFGVTIRMSDPLGVITTLGDASIIRRSDMALDVSAIFDRQGIYTLVIVNPSGETSDAVTLTVN